MSKYKLWRALRGGVWVKLEKRFLHADVIVWTRRIDDVNLWSYRRTEKEDYRNQSIWKRIGGLYE